MKRYSLDRRQFYFWLNQEEGRRDRYRLAQKESAGALVDDAELLLEQVDPNTGDPRIIRKFSK
jgi:hypothetical protein